MATMNELFSNKLAIDLVSKAMLSNDIQILKGARVVWSMKPKLVGSGLKGYRKLKGLNELPILKVWPKDAGRFITFPLVITKSPADSSVNVGLYRMQIFDDVTTGMHWQAQKGGAIHAKEAAEIKTQLPVAVVIGSDPFNMVSAATPLPHGINEFSFAGMLRGTKTVLMKNGKYPDVPANAEIILNGYVDYEEKRTEGPFGDHTGYYSIPEPANVFHVKEIYAKKNAIYAASIVGRPWNEDSVIGQFMVEYLKPMIRMVNSSIIDIYLPPEGIFTGICFISIKKRFPGEAKKTMFSVLGLGQLSLTKIIAVFDEDVNIRDFGDVMWAIATRVEPERDIDIIKNITTDTLDHTSNISAYGSKILIDATKKSKEEGYARDWPETISTTKEIFEKAMKKWKQEGH